MSDAAYDALLVVSFGGPEGREEVLPFLENVLRGRNVPRQRMLEVACHYDLFDGVSPLNAQNRALIAALEQELAAHRIDLPVYFGNRNWHPLLTDTVKRMSGEGVRRALALFTTAYSSYSSCRQYRENIADAQHEAGPKAPEIHKLRAFYNHPGFVSANADCLLAAVRELGAAKDAVTVLFTAHSIPEVMAEGCLYRQQLSETASLVARQAGTPGWELVFQSRSGPPSQPWLEPDVVDRIGELAADGVPQVVLAPVGFLSDHLEVLYDLDHEAAAACRQLSVEMKRAATVGTHPGFVSMIRELIQERLDSDHPRRALGEFGPSHDFCPAGCCPSGSEAAPSAQPKG